MLRIPPLDQFCQTQGKQEVDVPETWKGEARYKSLCQSLIPKIKSFPPVEAEKSVTKGCTDGQGDCNIAPTLNEWGYNLI